MHAKADNPELKAQELGLKIYSYPEFLYEQSKSKTRVVMDLMENHDNIDGFACNAL
jgi:hypothetical protein